MSELMKDINKVYKRGKLGIKIFFIMVAGIFFYFFIKVLATL
jgi:hypothetical protein